MQVSQAMQVSPAHLWVDFRVIQWFFLFSFLSFFYYNKYRNI